MRHLLSPQRVAAGLLGLGLTLAPAGPASTQATDAPAAPPGRRTSGGTTWTGGGWACSGCWAWPACFAETTAHAPPDRRGDQPADVTGRLSRSHAAPSLRGAAAPERARRCATGSSASAGEGRGSHRPTPHLPEHVGQEPLDAVPDARRPRLPVASDVQHADLGATIPTATCDGRVNPPSTRRQDWLNWRQASIVSRTPGASMDPNQSVASESRASAKVRAGERPVAARGRRRGRLARGEASTHGRRRSPSGTRAHPTAVRDAARLHRARAGLAGAGSTAVDDRLQHGQDALRGTLDGLDVGTHQPIVAARPRARQGPVMSRVWSWCRALLRGPRRRGESRNSWRNVVIFP